MRKISSRYNEKEFTMSETSRPIPQALGFPYTVFRTKKRMDDYSADDMRCGDLSETQLKTDFNLHNISSKVNPYTLTLFKQLKPTAHGYGYAADRALESEKVTRQECVRILFDEFRYESRIFALHGPYKNVIEKMINHMQNGNGIPFRDLSLNTALRAQIINDKSAENSSLLRIKQVLTDNIDWKNNLYPAEKLTDITETILGGILPKFDRLQDRVNGLGITVHDIYAAHITIRSLQINNGHYRAVVHYNVQDHFGLDRKDIIKFRNYRIFRIWFVLQRFTQLGYKPFMTNMEATVEIIGGRNESKK